MVDRPDRCWAPPLARASGSSARRTLGARAMVGLPSAIKKAQHWSQKELVGRKHSTVARTQKQPTNKKTRKILV